MAANAFAKDLLGKPPNLNCFSAGFIGGGSKRQRWRIVRHFPLLTPCPYNLALPFDEGERKCCQVAAFWASKLHGTVGLDAQSWTPASPVRSTKAMRLNWALLLPPMWAFLPLFPHSFLYQSFSPFPSLIVVPLSFPLLLQALFGGFWAKKFAFCSMFQCEMAGMILRHTVVYF